MGLLVPRVASLRRTPIYLAFHGGCVFAARMIESAQMRQTRGGLSHSPSIMEYVRDHLPKNMKDALFAVYVASHMAVFASPYKFAYLTKRISGSHLAKTVLFYPERPNHSHAIYKILHMLGCKITGDPTVKADLVINWDHSTLMPITPRSGRPITLEGGSLTKSCAYWLIASGTIS